MSKRYGRNQKRCAREQIEALEAERASLQYRLRIAQRQAQLPWPIPLNHPLTRHVVERMWQELVRQVGDHLAREVMKRAQPVISTQDDYERDACIVRIYVPSFNIAHSISRDAFRQADYKRY